MTRRWSSALTLCCSLLVVSWPASDTVAQPEVLVASSSSVEQIAGLARELPLGSALRVEGMVLEAGAQPAALELRRFQVFTPDASIVVHQAGGVERSLVPPSHAWYRGRVAGDPWSRVVLTVPAEGAVRGLVTRGGRVWALGEESGGRRAGALVARSVAADEAEEPFACGNDELPLAPHDDELFGSVPQAQPELAATTTPYTARVAVETDYELFLRLGSVQAIVDYVADLFAYSSTIYDDEILTELQVSHVSTWVTPLDPWTQTSTSCAFFEFGRYWNDNRAAIPRTIAHFLSGKSTGGGVAWVGVLCQSPFNVNLGSSCPGLSPAEDNYGGGYGFTGSITGSFDPGNPSAVWDLVAASHEIGHNFNSPHTHCYGGIGGSSAPVDQCSSSQCGQPGCHCGTSVLPCGTVGGACGTLMSYCHLGSGGLSNIALTFGTGHPYGVTPQRVPNRMRAHVEARAASNAACLARVSLCDDLELTATTVNITQLFETCGTLRAHGGFEVLTAGNVTLKAGHRVILGDGFSVQAGGRLRVQVP
ncbi:MAG TPA: M12 family metallo-peptidase [Thermoanaerobaculia bacterium]|nr:M12 family metallo-peptidase [Thermoanaerobaculia bacterium]